MQHPEPNGLIANGGRRADMLRAVDFFAHLMHGQMLQVRHQNPASVPASLRQRQSRVEARLGPGSVEALYGTTVEHIVGQAISGPALRSHGIESLDLSLYYLEASLGNWNVDEQSRWSLNAAGVGAVVAGRVAIGTGSADARVKASKLVATMPLADDGTAERLEIGLTGSLARFSQERGQHLVAAHAEQLPNTNFLDSTRPDPDRLLELGGKMPEDPTILGPSNMGAEWVDRLSVAALSTPLTAGRDDLRLP